MQTRLDLGIGVPVSDETAHKAEIDQVSRSCKPRLEESWLKILEPEFNKDYMLKLKAFLEQETKQYIVYPEGKNIFNAFWKTPFDKVKVVILGQDPYHGPKQAHGLCFSVSRGVPAPPSLINIFKELNSSLRVPIPKHGCLESWAQQGVFLLNTVLTVRAGQPQSHAGQGWEIFTDKVIEVLNAQRQNLVFMLWGSPARRKAAMIDRQRHLVLEAAHPSPLSAHKGFFGSNHFKLANDYLSANSMEAIDWTLSV
jgi:uracil-DNA glycosylase